MLYDAQQYADHAVKLAVQAAQDHDPVAATLAQAYATLALAETNAVMHKQLGHHIDALANVTEALTRGARRND